MLDQRNPSQTRALVFGVAGIGFLVGIFVTWSSSPLLGTLIPLIFGLIGGASGLSVLRFDVTNEKDSLKLSLVGRTLGAFSVACLLAVTVGLLLRPALRWYDRTEFTKKTEKIDLDDIILRRKLKALGAESAEINQTLLTSHLYDSDKAALKSDLSELNATVLRFITAFEKLGRPSPDYSSGDTIDGLYVTAKKIQPYLSTEFQELGTLQPEIAGKQIIKHLSPLANADFEAILGSKLDDKMLLSNSELTAEVVRLESVLDSNRLAILARIPKIVDNAVDVVNQLPALENKDTNNTGGGGGDGGGGGYSRTPWNIFSFW